MSSHPNTRNHYPYPTRRKTGKSHSSIVTKDKGKKKTGNNGARRQKGASQNLGSSGFKISNQENHGNKRKDGKKTKRVPVDAEIMKDGEEEQYSDVESIQEFRGDDESSEDEAAAHDHDEDDDDDNNDDDLVEEEQGEDGDNGTMKVMDAVVLSRKSGSVSTLSTQQSAARIEEQDLLIQELQEKTDGLQKMVENKRMLMGKNKRRKKEELGDLDHLNRKEVVDWSKSTLFPLWPILPPKYTTYVEDPNISVSGAIMNIVRLPQGWTRENYWTFIFCGIFSEQWGVIQMNYKGKGYIAFKGKMK